MAPKVDENKTKYLEACLEQRWHFSLFVLSTNGLFDKQARILPNNLFTRLVEKWKHYSEVCGYFNARMLSTAIVRATYFYLPGSYIPMSKKSFVIPLGEDKAI